MERIKINQKRQRLINNVYLQDNESLVTKQTRVQKLTNQAYDLGSNNIDILMKNQTKLLDQNKKLQQKIEQLKNTLQQTQKQSKTQINELKIDILMKQYQINELNTKINTLQKQLSQKMNKYSQSIIEPNPQVNHKKNQCQNNLNQIENKHSIFDQEILSESKIQNVKLQTLMEQFKGDKVMISEVVSSGQLNSLTRMPHSNSSIPLMSSVSPVKVRFQSQNYPLSQLVNQSSNNQHRSSINMMLPNFQPINNLSITSNPHLNRNNFHFFDPIVENSNSIRSSLISPKNRGGLTLVYGSNRRL